MSNPAIVAAGPGVVRLVDLPDPGWPVGSQVRIAMLRMPINPADLLAIDGRYAFSLDEAAPLGAEGAGRIVATGPDAGDLAVGDLVIPLTRGNWCTCRLLDRAEVIALPPETDPAVGAMLRINPPTARLLLNAAAVRAGDVLVQNGAGSAVAGWVRWFAEALDVTVIDVVRSDVDGLPLALRDGPDLAERIRAVAAGRPVRAALDCVAGDATGRLAAALAPGGRLILFGHLSGRPIEVTSQLLTGGGLSITGFSLRPAEAALGLGGAERLFANIFASLDGMPPHPPVRATFPFAGVGEALALARAGGGRILLRPDE